MIRLLMFLISLRALSGLNSAKDIEQPHFEASDAKTTKPTLLSNSHYIEVVIY